MSASKLVELVSATSAAAADVVYLVQSGVDKKLTLATLFSTLATPLRTTSTVALGGAEQTINNNGAVNIAATITVVNNTLASALTLAVGTVQGHLKVIVSGTLADNAVIGSTATNQQITFDQDGQAVLLMWIGSAWVVLGGTATIV